MRWVDIGINLTNRRYQENYKQVVTDALKVGVDKMIITGTNNKESQKALELAQSMPKILYSTAGCHPHDAKSLNADMLSQIEALLAETQVVAIGECGLDFNRNFSTKEQQIKAFKQQLELAIKWQKPVFLHERDAFDTQFQILKDYMPRLKGAVSHCFTGTSRSLEMYLELGLYIGITGWVCDERRGQALYDAVHLIPDDRLMIETDGPYLTPRNLKKKPKDSLNESKYLPHIAKTIAQARSQSLTQIAKISYANSCNFFKLDS